MKVYLTAMAIGVLLSVQYAANFAIWPVKTAIPLIHSDKILSQMPPVDSVDDPLKKLDHVVNHFYQAIPQEKVYVHLDKPFYEPRETIWGKVYVLDANTHLPSSVSDIVYLDILDPKGGVARTFSLYAEAGVANFEYDLGETGGVYTVRAYTRWLRNGGETGYFTRTIQVQQVVAPKILLKLDFLQKAYGPGSLVEAELDATDLKNNKITGWPVNVSVMLGGQKLPEQTALTNTEGKALLQFRLPADLQTTDGLLSAFVTHNGYSERISRSIPIVLERLDVQFMPEGGQAIAHITQRIAFKSVNVHGKGADIEGVVVDEAGHTVTAFRSFHQGMGSFVLTQATNKVYYAQIQRPFSLKLPLPQAADSGYALAVDTVQANSTTLRLYCPDQKPAYVIAQSGGKLFFTQKTKGQAGWRMLNIDTRKAPIGIAQLTVVDADGQPRAERLVFLNAHRQLRIRLETDKAQYLPREKVQVSIRTTDGQGSPVAANLSISAVNEQILNVADDKQDNILSWLLLGSELQGKVEEPAFYFNPAEKKAAAAIDYLMLTHGWRKFSWAKAATPKQYVRYLPEKNATLAGRILDSRSQPIPLAKVALFELGDATKGIVIRANQHGRFTFEGINPQKIMQLIARSPQKHQTCTIALDSAGHYTAVQALSAISSGRHDLSAAKIIINKATDTQNSTPTIKTEAIALNKSRSQLKEVTIVGYGREQSDAGAGGAGSSMYILNDTKCVDNQHLLQGRLAGISVQRLGYGHINRYNIRGAASLSGISQPLYLVDDIPVTATAFGSIDLKDMDHMTVITDLKNTALYGTNGANGVLNLLTQKALTHQYRARPASNYQSLIVAPLTQTSIREFYAPKYTTLLTTEARNDFRTTVFWQANVLTDAKGEASIAFHNSDAISAFRLCAEGIGKGLIGREEKTWFTLKPLQVDVQMPLFLTVEDTARIPVYLRNNSPEPVTATIDAILSAGGWNQLQPIHQTIDLKPNEKRTIFLPVAALRPSAAETLTLRLKSSSWHDEIQQTLPIRAKGFPDGASLAGNQMETEFRFHVPKCMPGSLTGRMVIYPGIIQNLLSITESIIREPYGCFEQVTSSTFPNILALQIMEEQIQAKPEVKKRALDYIENGYKKLIGYEIAGGGFDWFGRAPAHETLSALGLVEFIEMKKVYAGVDDRIITRTRDWLLSRRDGKGGFLNDRGHGTEILSPNIHNAFIVYALARANVKNINLEYTTAFNLALQHKDPYQMALLALAGFDLGKPDQAQILLDKLRPHLDSLHELLAEGTWTASGGLSNNIETVAFAGLSLLKTTGKDLVKLSEINNFINNKRQGGIFGSTQGTIAALQYLVGYIRQFPPVTTGSGTVELWNHEELLASAPVSLSASGSIELKGWLDKIKPGDQHLRVKFKQINKAIPFAVDLNWHSYTPVSQPDCAVDLQTTLSADTVKQNETVRLTTAVTNRTDRPLPMTIACVGIPAGLAVQPWQLKALQEKGVFDFYEIHGHYLAFYYRSLQPREIKRIDLDLSAAIPGGYAAPAGAAYLYYTKEWKDWETGPRILIQ